MYIVKNAFKNISRSLGRNILIGLITLVIAVSSCIALSIKEAAKTAEEQNFSNLSITATIGVDMQKLQTESNNDRNTLRTLMSQYSSLSLEEMQTYAQSSYVKAFNYSLQSSVSKGDGIEPYSEDEITETTDSAQGTESNEQNKTGNQQFGPGAGFGRMGQQGDFTIIGYSSEAAMSNFVNGTNIITEGEVFSFEESDNSCIISDILASDNSLEVGDTINLTNPNVSTETYTLTIAGIFSTTSSSDSGMMKFSTSQDPLNYIYTSYNTLNAIVESSVANAVVETDDNGNESTTALRTVESGVYSFTDVESYENFKTDATALGLPDNYQVTSTDISNYEESLVPIQNLSQFADVFLILVWLIGGIILVVINIFNIRERKYEVGVLTAIGMKKWKVALQFMTELFFVTITAIIIGTSVGALASAPVADNLLEIQISSAQSHEVTYNNNFGRGASFGGGMGMMGNSTTDTDVSYIDSISASTDLAVVMQLIGIGLVLTIVSSCASVGSILRYEPLKILSNRN